MRFRSRRMAIAVGLIGTGGFLMAGPGTGCLSDTIESSLVATDFCFIFDCQNGMLGGTIDPCVDVQNRTWESDLYGPTFSDCQVEPDEP